MALPGGYPGVTKAHLDIAKTYTSPLLVGPRLCDELVALVEHMYTDEEAEVMRHMKPWLPRTAAGLARASGKAPEEAFRILKGLGEDKCVILSLRKGGREFFMMLPILPGAFEFVMLKASTGSPSSWQRRFAELHEALYETGFMAEYARRPLNAVRYLPVGEVLNALPMAYPSDRLEAILERYDDFAVMPCQCRASAQLVEKGCGRRLETCTVLGKMAPAVVKRGFGKKVGMRDVLELKAAAEKEGLVTWMMNNDTGQFTSAACSCCGCCCDALRTVSEFSQPGLIAPPHFMPAHDGARCVDCGDCRKACPMGALVAMGEGDAGWTEHQPRRCIGCGLCVMACTRGARSMREVPGYRRPPESMPAYMARYSFNALSNGFHVWRSRRHDGEKKGM
jgi:electron transport complex protein RnfB